jgi:hypothetical protein
MTIIYNIHYKLTVILQYYKLIVITSSQSYMHGHMPIPMAALEKLIFTIDIYNFTFDK